MPTSLPRVIEELRKRLVTEPLRRDPRTTSNLPLGLGPEAARRAIEWGQADFDAPFGTLSAEDRVLLYAYWNQKRHLEELSEAFRQLFDAAPPKDPLIVVDLGCGPFTGGLALAGQLGAGQRFDYIGIDRSQAMRVLGERFAIEAEHLNEAPQVERHWAAEVSEIDWQRPLGWRPVLVIVSFLLASESVDAKALVHELDGLLAKLSRGETSVVYTNSPKERPNRSLPAFGEALAEAGFRSVVEDTGQVEARNRPLKLRYALFHRTRQRTLPLGEN